jgi:citryl-CoA lyase
MQFHTSISGEVNGETVIRGKKLTDLIGSVGYTQALYLVLTGKEATAEQAAVLDAILVSCIEHGVAPATGFVPRVVAASGNEVTHALAAGVLAVGPYHGGAVESAMKMFQQCSTLSPEQIEAWVTELREKKGVLYGFGHRVYKDVDPRAEKLLQVVSTHVEGKMIATARAVGASFEKVTGKHLVLNIDGAISACLLEIGLPPEAGNGIFALARMGGMLAHVLEEKQQKVVLRRLEDSEVVYE